MSTTRLGRAENLDRYWSESLLTSSKGRVQIESVTESHVEPLPEIEDYPYEGQRSIRGEFDYAIPGRKQDTVHRKAEYEYRTASGLFLINTEIDRIDPDRIISEINSRISADAEISDSIQVSRRDFWGFLDRAGSIEELKLRNKRYTYDAADLLRVLQSENPIDELDQIETERGKEIENLRKIASQIDANTPVESLYDLDIDLYEQIIVSSKATFWYRDQLVTLVYNEGLMWVEAEEDSAREYIIQLFERDVVYPSYD